MNADEAEQFSAFLAVVETGSFTAAARRLARDASVISRRVAALEARLGIRLLERSTRRVAPTEAGTIFRDKVRVAMDALEEAQDAARSMADAPTGCLRLSLPAGFGRKWIAPRLPDFLARYPALGVDACYSDRFVDPIAEQFDVCVRIGLLSDSRLIAQTVSTLRGMICASPAYLDKHPVPRVPADLHQHRCIGFTPLSTHPVWHLKREGDGTSRVATRENPTRAGTRAARPTVEHASVRIQARLLTDDIDTAVYAALSGEGLLLGADWLVAEHLRTGQLREVLPGWQLRNDAQLSVVRASSRHTPAKTRAFLTWFGNCFQDPPWR
jgi:DNA-binding transcriptional LysR family regulator